MTFRPPPAAPVQCIGTLSNAASFLTSNPLTINISSGDTTRFSGSGTATLTCVKPGSYAIYASKGTTVDSADTIPSYASINIATTGTVISSNEPQTREATNNFNSHPQGAMVCTLAVGQTITVTALSSRAADWLIGGVFVATFIPTAANPY